MINVLNRPLVPAGALLAPVALFFATAAADTTAARPGIDRPIRVGLFMGAAASSSYWHASIHASHAVMRNILAAPSAAGLGDSLVTPPAGFTVHSMSLPKDSTGSDCSGTNCAPTAQQIADFTEALDTLDVMLLSNVTLFGSLVTQQAHRDGFADFWTRKGYVAIHWMTETAGLWPPLDSLQGARLRGHPPEQDGTIRIDSAHRHEQAWRFLNRGLFSNGRDTTLYEEWMYFTQSGSSIRSNALLRPTVILDETSIADPGSQQPMGDHPISWYKQLPTGGRFFYTALGHRAESWDSARTFRRQVYNAVLWAAKYDSLAETASVSGADVAGGFSDAARVSNRGGTLAVSIRRDGPHAVELRDLDGRRIATARGTGRTEHRFGNLGHGLFILTVHADGARISTIVSRP